MSNNKTTAVRVNWDLYEKIMTYKQEHGVTQREAVNAILTDDKKLLELEKEIKSLKKEVKSIKNSSSGQKGLITKFKNNVNKDLKGIEEKVSYNKKHIAQVDKKVDDKLRDLVSSFNSWIEEVKSNRELIKELEEKKANRLFK